MGLFVFTRTIYFATILTTSGKSTTIEFIRIVMRAVLLQKFSVGPILVTIVFIVLVLFVPKAAAENVNIRAGLLRGLGVGQYGSDDNTALLVDIYCQFGVHVVSVRSAVIVRAYSYSDEKDQDEGRDIGLLYGLAAQRNKWQASIHAGVGATGPIHKWRSQFRECEQK